MVSMKNFLPALSAAICLASCGEGGSSGGSENVVAVPPSPTPMPTPTPTSTPIPTSPVFTIGLAGPFLGEVTFDSNYSGMKRPGFSGGSYL